MEDKLSAGWTRRFTFFRFIFVSTNHAAASWGSDTNSASSSKLWKSVCKGLKSTLRWLATVKMHLLKSPSESFIHSTFLR